MKRLRSGSIALAGGAVLAVALFAGVAHSDLGRPDTRPRPKGPTVPRPAGPAGKDATFRGSFARTGEGAGKLATRPKILWTAHAGGDIGYPGQPVMADGMVFSGSRDSAIFAFDAATGREKWNYATGGGVYTSPTYSGGVVYAGAYDDKLYAIDARSGDKKWDFTTADIIEGAVCVMDGVVYLPSFDGKLYALDAASGKKKWAYDAGGPMRATPACVGDTIYVGADASSRGAVVAAVSRAGGKRKWEAKLDGDSVTLAVAVSGKSVYIAGQSGAVYSFDAGSGKRRWKVTGPGDMSHHAVAVAAGLVVACGQGDGCTAFDADTGAERWVARKAGDVVGAAIYGEGYFYAARNVGGDSEVIAMDAKNGKIAWTLPTDGTSRTSIGLFDGVLLHGTEIGNLYAIGNAAPVASAGSDPARPKGPKKKGPPPEIACDRALTKSDIPAFPLRGWVDGKKWEFADGAAVKKSGAGDMFLVNHPYKGRCSVDFSDPDDSVEVGVFLGRLGKSDYAGARDVDFINYRAPGDDEAKDTKPNIVVSIDDGDFTPGGWVSGSIAACFEDGSWIGGEFSVPVCKE